MQIRARLARAIETHRQGRLADAIDAYHEVLQHDASQFDALRLLGAALVATGRAGAALESLERALAIRSDLAEVWALRGDALSALQRHEQAAASFERAIALRPDDARSHYHRGLLHLVLGRFETGWDEYDWRQRVPELDVPAITVGRAWDGRESLEGRTLLLAAEQGLGDTIQFCRFVPLLAERGARVLLWAPPALCGLLTSLPGLAQALRVGEAVPPFDLQCRLLSLPARLGTTLATVPSQVPYLAPSRYKLEQWRARLGPARRPRIGLVCSGNPKHVANPARSVPLRDFEVLRGLDCELHLLQKDLGEADRPWLETLAIADHRPWLDDFEDAAALVSCMDVVVSVCTSVAHLAGALGKPLYMLLGASADWRWMLQREDSPWYPTARLLRQSVAGDWAEPLQRLKAGLSSSLEGRVPAPVAWPQPQDADISLMQAIDLHRQGYLARAVDRYRQVLGQPAAGASGDFDALRLLGAALTGLDDGAAALPALDSALALREDSGEVWAVRGDALARLGRCEESAASLERALRLCPDRIQFINLYGVRLEALGRYEEALQWLQRARTLAPEDLQTRYNLGLHHLTLGRLELGWDGYELRDRFGPWARPEQILGPAWDGQAPLEGVSLLLTADEGLGDTIQFCRFVAPLAARGARVLLGVQPPLRELLGSVAGVTQVITDGDPMPAYDRHCRLLSVPHRLGTSLSTLPAKVPYLSADPLRVRAWRDRLGTAARPRIGIACSGNPMHVNDRARSVGLQHFAALQPLQCELHLLQNDVRDADRPWLARLAIFDHRDRLTDFSQTAALASCMDAVVSIDTSIAHLAGALALPLFLLLPFTGDWRWMLDRDDSPWYPTARLFRQARPDEWEAPMQRLREALQSTLRHKTP